MRIIPVLVALTCLVGQASDFSIIITHASRFWDHLEETKWPAIGALAALRDGAKGTVSLVSLEGGERNEEYFLTPYVDPASVVYSKEGELPTAVFSPRVFLIGGNFSDCSRITVRDILKSWSRSKTLVSDDLELLFVTPAIFDYVRGVDARLRYPEAIEEKFRALSSSRRARTGIGSPTFRLDVILDHFSDEDSRLDFLCTRAMNAYDVESQLPDHTVEVRLGEKTRQCSKPKKRTIRFHFVYPDGAKDRSLKDVIEKLL